MKMRYTAMGTPLPLLLKELRRSTGLSRGQFAERLGVLEGTIGRVERGTMCPPQAVMDAYGEIARRRSGNG